MKYFENCKNIEELKKMYKELARNNHPDLGGDLETMQQINNEYDKAIEYFKIHGSRVDQAAAKAETPEKFRKIINDLVKMQGVTIEIIGSWVWLSGNTAHYLRKIKSMGFAWSSKQKKYYLSDNGIKKRASRLTMKEIREMYGSQIIENTTKYIA